LIKIQPRGQDAAGVSVGVDVGVAVLVAVVVGVLVGSGERHVPFTQTKSAAQHSFEQARVSGGQMQVRRPRASFAPHIPEQHVAFSRQLWPAAAQLAASPFKDQPMLEIGPPIPIARAAALPSAWIMDRRDVDVARVLVSSSNRCWSIVLLMIRRRFEARRLIGFPSISSHRKEKLGETKGVLASTIPLTGKGVPTGFY
jgi:hypothetical protein